MQDQRPCEEFRSWRELVEDPLTRMVMEADQVGADELSSLCRALELSARDKREAVAAVA